MSDLRTFDKVKAAAAGGGLGGAVAQIIVWLLDLTYGIDAAPIEVSLSVVLAALGSFVAGWYKREGVIEEEFTDAEGGAAGAGL